MKAALVNLQYPYGKKMVYLNYSLVSIAARLAVVGHEATIVDLNIDEYEDPYTQGIFKESDLIGVSLLGAPSMPSAIEFTQRVELNFPGKLVAVGGQVIEHISRDGFVKLFGDKVKQIVDDRDFAEWIGEKKDSIPHYLDISYKMALEAIGFKKLRQFLSREQSLIMSDGCVHNCTYCAARKGCRERYRNLEALETDLTFLTERARASGLTEVALYASALDFCQNIEEMGKVLCITARVQKKVGVRIRLRCLTCMDSYLRTPQVIESLIQQGQYQGFANFHSLVEKAGWDTIGAGVDGASERVWNRLKKRHNKIDMVPKFIALCRKLGQKAEILMVMGFEEDTPQELWQTFKNSVLWAFRNKCVLVRPYFAKIVPGSDGWPKIEKQFTDNPRLFFDLDYCALGSRATHPRWWHRWLSNLTYLAIIAILSPFGKCDTLPLLPQGQKGLYGAIARWVNRNIPSDR